jgi:hypothetical protein
MAGIGNTALHREGSCRAEEGRNRMTVTYGPTKVSKDELAALRRRAAAEREIIKVGVTRNVAARLKSLQVGNPDKLRVVFSQHVSNCIFVEQATHATLAATRQSGEWFGCNELEAVAAVQHQIDKLK